MIIGAMSAAATTVTVVPDVRPSAFLFDLDGTLALTDDIHFGVFKSILAERGVTVTPEFYSTHIHGRHNPDIFRDCLGALGGPPPAEAECMALAERKEAAFRAIVRERGLPPMVVRGPHTWRSRSQPRRRQACDCSLLKP